MLNPDKRCETEEKKSPIRSEQHSGAENPSRTRGTLECSDSKQPSGHWQEPVVKGQGKHSQQEP